MTNVAGFTPPSTNDLRPIQPPVRLPGEMDWVWWTLAGLVVVGALAVWWYRRRRLQASMTPVAVIPPHIRARQRLAEALLFISEPDRFCTAVSNTLRVYLEERFHLHAPERTTEEFLAELQGSPVLNAEQKKSLQHFLQSCDLVKFARFEPTETTLRDLHDSALRLVDETQFDPFAIASPAAAAAPSSDPAPAPVPAPAPPQLPTASPGPPPVPAAVTPSDTAHVNPRSPE
jgi:LPXTG-motif cell wall-anchored protein